MTDNKKVESKKEPEVIWGEPLRKSMKDAIHAANIGIDYENGETEENVISNILESNICKISDEELEKAAFKVYPIKQRAAHLDPYDENKYDRDKWMEGAKYILNQNKK